MGVVQLLECEPGLGDGLSGEDLAVASQALPVPMAVLKKGTWTPRSEPSEVDCVGYLIAKGLLVRRVEVAQGSSAELLGNGDLLRPWQEDASSFCAGSWEVLERTTVLALGPGFTRGLAQWPTVAANLAIRGLRRSRALAADAAIASIVGIEERLLIMLWHLAERWGCRHLAYAWRMFTAYPRKKQVVIVALDKHERDHNPAADLAEVLPGLATTGRKRSAKPPCCEDAADPPAMNEELGELLSALS